jgi:dolichol-phosphate mannosyltransferase
MWDGDAIAFMPLAYSIVTATYNEAENIADFLRAVAAAVRPLSPSFEIIVVDDNSPDGTGAIVRQLDDVPEARLITRTDERGIGSAYLRGLKEARGRLVSAMDADFSHPPSALPALLTAADTGALAIGSRFLRASDFDTLWYRYLPTRSINLWHRGLLRTRVHDHTNGFIALPKPVLELLLKEADRIGIRPFDRILYQLVLITIARRMGLTVKELPAKYVFRTRGQTKIRFLRGLKLLWEEWMDSLRLAPYRWGLRTSAQTQRPSKNAKAA